MKNNKAAVFILLGQSNAVGHAIPMDDKDKICTPLKNVYGLKRETNQTFENKELYWSGYTSDGMNLAEEQDHTYSVANCLARMWQDEIDAGNKRNLPDLYIVHIAIGAQGVTEGYMWNPNYEKKIIPGKLGTVDIALTPFTNHILSMLKDSFDKMGKTFEVFGMHWRGSESDAFATWEELKNNAKNTHYEMFDSFFKSIGREVPVILHYRVSFKWCEEKDPGGEHLKKVHYLNQVFDELSREHKNMSVFDVRKAPFYNPDVREDGIFSDDAIHYAPHTNRWVAEQIFNNFQD